MMWWKYQQLRSGSLKTRLATVAKLADTGHPDAIPPLLFALKDKTSEIRSSAAMALGQIQDDRVFEPLIKLLRDPVPSVRATAGGGSVGTTRKSRNPSATGVCPVAAPPGVTWRAMPSGPRVFSISSIRARSRVPFGSAAPAPMIPQIADMGPRFRR